MNTDPRFGGRQLQVLALGVVGSNPATPTIFDNAINWLSG